MPSPARVMAHPDERSGDRHRRWQTEFLWRTTDGGPANRVLPLTAAGTAMSTQIRTNRGTDGRKSALIVRYNETAARAARSHDSSTYRTVHPWRVTGPSIASVDRAQTAAGVIEGSEAEMAPRMMSVYQVRPKRAIDDDNVTRSVRSGGAPTPVRKPVIHDSAQDWVPLRKAKPVNYMLPASMQWLNALPKVVRPWALITEYPRIANLLVIAWGNPTACRAYFDNLLVDRRGNRKGFPPDVLRDLQRLRDYFCNLTLTLEE